MKHTLDDLEESLSQTVALIMSNYSELNDIVDAAQSMNTAESIQGYCTALIHISFPWNDPGSEPPDLLKQSGIAQKVWAATTRCLKYVVESVRQAYFSDDPPNHLAEFLRKILQEFTPREDQVTSLGFFFLLIPSPFRVLAKVNVAGERIEEARMEHPNDLLDARQRFLAAMGSPLIRPEDRAQILYRELQKIKQDTNGAGNVEGRSIATIEEFLNIFAMAIENANLAMICGQTLVACIPPEEEGQNSLVDDRPPPQLRLRLKAGKPGNERQADPEAETA